MRRPVWALAALLLVLLPVGVLAAEPPADGLYTVELTLEGGSGRASVESPAELSVSGGAMTATLVWSSANYDAMWVDGVRYDPVNTEGNSAFAVPVVLDEAMPVTARTLAMGEPHEIDYLIALDSSTLRPQGLGGGVPWWMGLVVTGIAAVLMLCRVGLMLSGQRRAAEQAAKTGGAKKKRKKGGKKR